MKRSTTKELWTEVTRRLNADAIADVARDALRIRSISGEEEDVARFFVKTMKSFGLDAELQRVPATSLMGPSFNAIGRLKGGGGGLSLMLNGHMDHNPVSDGWTKDPFSMFPDEAKPGEVYSGREPRF
jgi:acetylornithine deacetylase